MVVTPISKILAWITVILFNLFFVYFVALKSMTRDSSFQRGFVTACLLQLIIEVFVYETSECVYVHFIIPRLVHKEVTQALVDLKRYVNIAFSPKGFATGALDAPNYFFVSTQLAKRWPHLFECSVVQAFHSIYPGAIAAKWQKRKNETYTSGFGFKYVYNIVKRTLLFSSVGSMLQHIGAFPMRIQKMALHTLQPLCIAIVFISVYLFVSYPVYAVIPGALIVFAIVHNARKNYVKRKRGNVTPVPEEDDISDDEDNEVSAFGISDNVIERDLTREDIIAQLGEMIKQHDSDGHSMSDGSEGDDFNAGDLHVRDFEFDENDDVDDSEEDSEDASRRDNSDILEDGHDFGNQKKRSGQ